MFCNESLGALNAVQRNQEEAMSHVEYMQTH